MPHRWLTLSSTDLQGESKVANDPIGVGNDGKPVFLKDLWPSPELIANTMKAAVKREQFAEEYEIAASYGNFLHRAIHKLNQIKIVAIYKIMS